MGKPEKYHKNNRKGEWIQTHTGIRLWPVDPRMEEIKLVDIAKGLSQTGRFNGQCDVFYSVAQHSIKCAEEAIRLGFPRSVALRALLHDGSEAYIADISRPVKQSLAEYQKIEAALQREVYKAFGLDPDDTEEERLVKEIDDLLLATEAKALCPHGINGWELDRSPADHIVVIDEEIYKLPAREFFEYWRQLFVDKAVFLVEQVAPKDDPPQPAGESEKIKIATDGLIKAKT